MPTVSPERLRRIAMRAAKKAGAQLVRMSKRPICIATHKGAGDAATTADIMAEKIIVAELLQHTPNAHILAEESGRHAGAADALEWIVDPLDGTRQFMRGLPLWCISIAVRRKKKVLAAAVYAPLYNQLYSACATGPAFHNAKRISVRPCSTATDAVVAFSRPMVRPAFSAFKRLCLSGASTRNIGSSALALCWLACGKLDGFMDLAGTTKLWDCAAGNHIAQRAGAKVLQLPARSRHAHVCSTAACHPRLVPAFTAILG